MAENDIYNSQNRYENFRKNIDLLVVLPENRKSKYNGEQNTTARTLKI